MPLVLPRCPVYNADSPHCHILEKVSTQVVVVVVVVVAQPDCLPTLVRTSQV